MAPNSMNKELNIRRRIANIYNKAEDEFPTLRSYNDYLEEVEDIVFNLVEGIDVQATEARIAAYQEENSEQIIASRAKKAERVAASFRAAAAKKIAEKDLEQDEDKEAAGASGIQAGAAGMYAPSVVAGSMFMQPRPVGPAGQPVPLAPSTYNGEFHEDPASRKLREERDRLPRNRQLLFPGCSLPGVRLQFPESGIDERRLWVHESSTVRSACSARKVVMSWNVLAYVCRFFCRNR
ncbi:hypothetical protein R1flu_010626 [Riccia fluitans]|uniref:MAT1 centre domain-containing protein n=1 Tax=Riccia fluitans TaxID=41844 RepID=A0ABD1Z7Z7_9MARC